MDVCACICLFVNAGEVSMEHLNEVVKLSELCKAAQDEPECDKQVGFLAYALLVQRRDRDAHTHPHTHARASSPAFLTRRWKRRLNTCDEQLCVLCSSHPNTHSSLASFQIRKVHCK